MAEQPRYQTVRTAFGCGVFDGQKLGRPIVRAGLNWDVAKRIEDELNDLNDENCRLRARLCEAGVEVRPTRKAG